MLGQIGSGIDDRHVPVADDVAAGSREGDRAGIACDDAPDKRRQAQAFAGAGRGADIEGKIVGHAKDPGVWRGGIPVRDHGSGPQNSLELQKFIFGATRCIVAMTKFRQLEADEWADYKAAALRRNGQIIFSESPR